MLAVLKQIVLNVLRAEGWKLLLLGILNGVGGLKLKLAQWAFNYLFDKEVVVAVNGVEQKLELVWNKEIGKIQAKHLREANDSGNNDAWDSTVDRM